MSKDSNIGDEEIIAFLMGELDEEKELMIQNALKDDPDLQKQQKILADTLRLVENPVMNRFRNLLMESGN